MSPIKRLSPAAGATFVAMAAGLVMSVLAPPAVASSAPPRAAVGGSAAGVAVAAGGSATDGTRTLRVNRATGLDPSGSLVTVTGSGYDESKGIYVAVCVDNGPGAVPTPCIGGVDMSGGSGGSVWISSNPPPYGEGLAKPYGKGGTFTVSLAVVAKDPVTGTDCRVTRCAVVTRNDHTRPQDRSQDLRIPISFAAAAPSTRSTTRVATTGKTVTTTKAGTTTKKTPTSTKRPTAPTSGPGTSAKPVTSTVVPATPSRAPTTPTLAGTNPSTATSSGIEQPASAVDSSESPVAPDETAVTTPDDRMPDPATASDGSIGAAGSTGSSSAASPPASAPVRSDSVEPAADTVDGSGFPVLLVVLIVIVVAALAAGGLLYYRRQHR